MFRVLQRISLSFSFLIFKIFTLSYSIWILPMPHFNIYAYFSLVGLFSGLKWTPEILKDSISNSYFFNLLWYGSRMKTVFSGKLVQKNINYYQRWEIFADRYPLTDFFKPWSLLRFKKEASRQWPMNFVI